MSIEIPTPGPGDSDQVVSALENAALFGRIGDNEEALRWLQRAAESASESGDDIRTLALARTAADLSGSMRSGADSVPTTADGQPGRQKRLPTPPRSRPHHDPLPAAEPAEDTATDEPTLLLTRSATHKEDQHRTRAAEAQASRPPPPSSRPLASRPAPSSRGLPAPSRPATPPGTGSTLTHATPSANATTSANPRAAVQSPSAPTPVAPSTVSNARPAPVRQTVRVSVEKSRTEAGLFLVRMLDEGQSPDAGRTEALLVSLEPGVELS